MIVCPLFCGQENLLGGQFWAMGRLNLLGGQIILLGGHFNLLFTSLYLPGHLLKGLGSWFRSLGAFIQSSLLILRSNQNHKRHFLSSARFQFCMAARFSHI